MLETKLSLLNIAKKELTHSLDVLRRAVSESHGNTTTGDQSKAEGKYDTRGIEASYLAKGQQEQLNQLEESLAKFDSLELVNEPDQVFTGSLVVVSTDEEDRNFLVLPAGGGVTIDLDDESYLIITPTSPIGSALLGKDIGAEITLAHTPHAYISEIY